MAPLLDGEDEARVDLGPHIILFDGKLGEAGIMVELGERGAGRRQCRLLRQHVFSEACENFELQGQRPVGSLGDARL